MCTKNQALYILYEVYNGCNVIFDGAIKEAYLYGSYARGDYHEESDIDILLVAEISQSEISSYRNSVALLTSELSLKYDITVSVAIKPLEQFRRFGDILPYYKNVLTEGIRYAG